MPRARTQWEIISEVAGGGGDWIVIPLDSPFPR